MTSTSHSTGAYRAFIALHLPPEVREYLEAVQRCLMDKGVRARWVRPDSMHLTLKFIGRLEAEKVAAIVSVLDTVAPQCRPLQLTVQGLGGFPTARRARVLWMGIGGEDARLVALQQELDRRLALEGWPPGARAFKGHLTLARAKGRRTLDAGTERSLALCEPATTACFTAGALTLYRSHLHPQGAVYEILHQSALKAAEGD